MDALAALAALGLVGNIVQLIDFVGKLVSKTREGYDSADGAFIENTDLETVTVDLFALTNKIKSNADAGSSVTNLEALCSSCADLANELTSALAKLKVQGGKSKWKSFRKALRCVWSKEEIQGIEKRLSSFRDQINLHVLVDLRDQFDVPTIKQSENYEALEANTQEILDLIIKEQDVFKRETEAQTSKIRSIHVETREIIVHRQTEPQTEIIEAIQVTEQHGDTEHEATRHEIAQLKDAIEELSKQMKQKDNELQEILTEFRNTRSPKKKKKLRERGNAISAALLAFEVMYRSLMSILKSLQERTKRAYQSTTYTWHVSPYPRYDRSAAQSESQIELLEHGLPPLSDMKGLYLRNREAGLPQPLSTYDSACSLYYAYYHTALHARASTLVDVDEMNLRWQPQEDHSPTGGSRFVNPSGLVFQTYSRGIPDIWVMAMIVSALYSWPFPPTVVGVLLETMSYTKFWQQYFHRIFAT